MTTYTAENVVKSLSMTLLDENELKYAQWVKREDIVLQPNNLSLTNEMMKVFKENKINITQNYTYEEYRQI